MNIAKARLKPGLSFLAPAGRGLPAKLRTHSPRHSESLERPKSFPIFAPFGSDAYSCARSYRTLRDGSFEGRFPRHFVPGYDRTVPPGQYMLSGIPTNR